MKNLLFLAILFSTFFLAAPFAVAGAYTMWDIDEEDTLKLHDDYNTIYNENGVGGAGMFTFTASNGSDEVVFTSWCAEYDVYIETDTPYKIKNFNKPNEPSDQSAWLLTQYFNGGWDKEPVSYAAQAQFQRALWSFDSDDYVKTPYYDDNLTDYISLANTAVNDDSWTNNDYIAIADLGDGVQNQYVPVTPTPEPATMVLFGMGLLGIGGVLRKRRKK